METEIKLEVPDLEPIRDRLKALEAECLGTVDETNVYFDRNHELRDGEQSLRLRQDGRNRLTWKGPTVFQAGVINRPEIEIMVSSFADATALLESIGFQEVERLIKRRETWRLSGIEIALDSLAFGKFVELEGPAEVIASTARAIGLDPRQGLSQSYRKLRRARSPH
ncbi:MAG TPA: class IV adenylate cyclase [Chloroflexota bacterium]|nr:class IV adenylate cyclase [Chloroflexota bacterium]